MYFNYHAKAKRLIEEGHLIRYAFMDSWGTIRPALVLFFDNEKPMPIRAHRWQEYLSLLSESVKKINIDKPPLFYKKVGAFYNFVLLCEILMKFSFLG